MFISPNTQAILLLTAHFSKPRGDAAKPLRVGGALLCG